MSTSFGSTQQTGSKWTVHDHNPQLKDPFDYKTYMYSGTDRQQNIVSLELTFEEGIPPSWIYWRQQLCEEVSHD